MEEEIIWVFFPPEGTHKQCLERLGTILVITWAWQFIVQARWPGAAWIQECLGASSATSNGLRGIMWFHDPPQTPEPWELNQGLLHVKNELRPWGPSVGWITKIIKDTKVQSWESLLADSGQNISQAFAIQVSGVASLLSVEGWIPLWLLLHTCA